MKVDRFMFYILRVLVNEWWLCYYLVVGVYYISSFELIVLRLDLVLSASIHIRFNRLGSMRLILIADKFSSSASIHIRIPQNLRSRPKLKHDYVFCKVEVLTVETALKILIS
ncbi:hypothetical protein L2E82_36357 [Cichorium intybus]|uniref:Uncharacterized protein n=1 Tax=Cichorium intybus TaxID=13427 RepID=A0ACB9BR98_CICIN|nr:hypothetical protein L2E82_36357 [Cichorium intybus]